MKAIGIASSFVVGMLAVVSCAVSANDDSLSDENSPALRDEGVGSSQQPIVKGRAGAVNGAIDYCNNPASPCASGEGDCDSNAQCSPGLICAPNNGPKFGFPSGWDVCAGSHCANKILDGDETAIDCGGSCGTCSSCIGTPGGENFCNGCLCGPGQGDCDSSAECATGLTCGVDNGSLFGLPATYDVCVPPHCTNGVQDAGETGIDDGGQCGTRASTCSGTPGSVNFCVGCSCASGQGDCDSDAECASGLSCAVNNGPKFGLPSGYDVCVPAHCTNRVQDSASGETGIDVGGECGTAVGICGDGVIGSGEACDDGINDGVLCSADCQTAVEVARILGDCADGTAEVASIAGTACNSFPGAGASYLSFSSSAAVVVTLYSNGDCTGNSATVSADLNFCDASFDEGDGLNDSVQSAKVQRAR